VRLGRVRLGVADLMLFTLVVTWAMNIVITRWVLTHGVEPLVYASLRYLLCGIVLAGYSRYTEGPFDFLSRGRLRLLTFGLSIFIVNQITFVYALKLTTASTVSLIFGVAPIVIAAIAFAVGTERVTSRFLVAALISVAGVALIAIESGGGPSTSVTGVGVAIVLMLTWSIYTVVAASLMSTWSPYRVAAVMFLTSGIAITFVASKQLADQNWNIHWYVWALSVYAVASLITTNLLYLVAMKRVGPSQTALYANFQPFVAVIFAMLILGESLTWLELAGGVAIAFGIGISWNERRESLSAAPKLEAATAATSSTP
jgi:drug/metabolite transporter (DMT)-like permease